MKHLLTGKNRRRLKEKVVTQTARRIMDGDDYCRRRRRRVRRGRRREGHKVK
jgi:hypothetical protein